MMYLSYVSTRAQTWHESARVRVSDEQTETKNQKSTHAHNFMCVPSFGGQLTLPMLLPSEGVVVGPVSVCEWQRARESTRTAGP